MSPDSEAPAQLPSSGIPGSYPVVLDFAVGSWEWILTSNGTKVRMWQQRSRSRNDDKKKAWINEASREQQEAGRKLRSEV
jgi:hypothetical protein